ncbi:MAG: hypothetical protein O6766_10865, partial [Gammaproteobacteria bacterium]|nr:hypothetical protein [Gammaproteobacteria bacterium]
FSDFEELTEGTSTLDAFAASIARGAYVLVGTGLSVQGVVFFQFKVDEDGRMDASFNVPLRYLVDNAGLGPDLGTGPIRLACRSQCPVPWHSVNLWEPEGEGDEHPAQKLQKIIWRNRLGLKPQSLITNRVAEDFVLEGARDDTRDLQAKLTEAFGEEGKLDLEKMIRHRNEQLTDVSTKYRSDMEQQQQTYLDQIRSCRDEIQKLKVELRNERERSRRLQQLLRGGP